MSCRPGSAVEFPKGVAVLSQRFYGFLLFILPCTIATGFLPCRAGGQLRRPVIALARISQAPPLEHGRPTGAESTSNSPEQRRSSHEALSLLGQGLKHLEQARYEQAIEAFRKALDLDPGLVTAHYDLGVAYFSLNQFDEARQAFEEVWSRSPGHRFAAYFLARLDLVRGDLDGAIRGFRALLREKPVADELYYLGSAYFRKGEMQQAIQILQRASDMHSGDYRIPFLLALAYRKTGQARLAERQAALSEELRNSYRQKSREILECNTALNSQKGESAVQQCRQLLDGVDPTKLVSLGVLLAERQLYEAALPPLAKAARIDPENYEPQFNLGLTYFRLKKYPEARQPLENALALRPESYDAAALLGSVLFALGDDYGAVRRLRHAHQLRPSDEKVKSLLFEQLRIIAQHLLAEKNYPESIPYFEEALALKPEATELRSQLAQATAQLDGSAKKSEGGKR
jgi:tetratricopeptide (TPR) repeat protein